jgi:hypothetical protein
MIENGAPEYFVGSIVVSSKGTDRPEVWMVNSASQRRQSCSLLLEIILSKLEILIELPVLRENICRKGILELKKKYLDSDSTT